MYGLQVAQASTLPLVRAPRAEPGSRYTICTSDGATWARSSSRSSRKCPIEPFTVATLRPVRSATPRIGEVAGTTTAVELPRAPVS